MATDPCTVPGWPRSPTASCPRTSIFLETPLGDRVLRAKYAVLSLAALERGTGRRAFHPYLWGRFAQPTALLYARTDAVAARVHAALAEAAATFVARVVPMLPEEFDAPMLWQRGLLLSYRAELRAERPESACLRPLRRRARVL